MSCCLICGEPGQDISQDLCPDCIEATFQSDHLGNAKPLLKRSLQGRLGELREMVEDFSEDSQQRWMLIMRKANELRDELWGLEQKEGQNV